VRFDVTTVATMAIIVSSTALMLLSPELMAQHIR
jgi:hypothetical protein